MKQFVFFLLGQCKFCFRDGESFPQLLQVEKCLTQMDELEGMAGNIVPSAFVLIQWWGSNSYLSRKQHEFFTLLRFTSIVPIFQKGKKEDPCNYRPISLISVSGEMKEKVILG